MNLKCLAKRKKRNRVIYKKHNEANNITNSLHKLIKKYFKNVPLCNY